jgi:rhomboid family GlyGly-CTERM serine protease
MTTSSSNVRQSKWLFCLGVSLVALTAMLWPHALSDLRYERSAVQAGQWWRLFTGHVVHLNAAHLLLNLGALVLVCELLWRGLPGIHGCGLLFFSAIGTSALLWWFQPELAWYAGLSGALHGLWAGCALAGWWYVPTGEPASHAGSASANAGTPQGFRWHPRYFFCSALMLLAVKLALEMRYGASPSAERMIGASIISVAHLYGAAAGTAYVFFWRCTRAWRSKRDAVAQN